MSKRDEFVEVAESQVGTRETGVNNIKYNTWYYGHEVNGTPGTSEYAWCVVFESWCANEVGILDTLVPKENYVPSLRKWYEDRGLYHSSNYTPKKGDIVIFRNSAHTGIVEYYDGQVHTIEGNSGNMVARHVYSVWGNIIGYCEVAFDEDESTPVITNAISEIQSTLNKRYGFSIDVDGEYGPETHMALVKALQIELNEQFSAGLDVDGIFGPATYNACIGVSVGACGNITWLIQAMLLIKGYPLVIDGQFGPITKAAVIAYQEDNGLAVDGAVGKNTFQSLFA